MENALPGIFAFFGICPAIVKNDEYTMMCKNKSAKLLN